MPIDPTNLADQDRRAEFCWCSIYATRSPGRSPSASILENSRPERIDLMTLSDVGLLRRIVGMSTLVAAVILAVGWAYRGPRGSLISGAFGALCGFLAGATGQGGPVSVTYFMAAPLAPQQQRGSIVATITGMIMVTFIAQVLSGAVTSRTLLLGLVMGFPLLAAVWAGSRLFELLPKQNYRRATLLLLFAAGVAALLK